VVGAPHEDLKQVTGPARAAGSGDIMGEAKLADKDISAPSPVVDENRESLVVVDFTVGPAGVGPPTSITPAHPVKPLPEPPRPD
jgi:hypothetical protein